MPYEFPNVWNVADVVRVAGEIRTWIYRDDDDPHGWARAIATVISGAGLPRQMGPEALRMARETAPANPADHVFAPTPIGEQVRWAHLIALACR